MLVVFGKTTRPSGSGKAREPLDPALCKQPPGVLQPRIDPNRCEGKGPCVEVCPVQVFVMGTLPREERAALSLKGRIKGFAHGWKQARVAAPQDCRGCGLCVTACPEHAIKLERRVAKDDLLEQPA
jgi:4Fe-4S ferredoxin